MHSIKRILDGEPHRSNYGSGHELARTFFSLVTLVAVVALLVTGYAGWFYLTSPLHFSGFSETFLYTLALTDIITTFLMVIGGTVAMTLARPVPSLESLEDRLHAQIDEEEY